MAVVQMSVNGQAVEQDVPDNTLLVSFIRETLGLTGTHVGCDTSQCGACVVHVNGQSVKSCTLLAAQARVLRSQQSKGLLAGMSYTLCSRPFTRIMVCSAVIAPQAW